MFADSDRLLVFGDKDFGFLAVYFDLVNLGWREGFADVFGSVIAPGDDVDFLFVADFVHDGLDTDAAATNEGADRVNARDGGGDGNLSAPTGFAGDAFDFDGVIFKLGNFLAEEIFNEFWTAAREDKLSTTVATFDIFDIDLDAVADGIEFAINLFGARHDAVRTTKVDANELGLDASDGAGNDGADFVLKGGEYGVVFGFAEALNDDLLSGHSGDTAKSGNFMLVFYDITKLGAFASFGKRNFGRWVVGEAIFDDFASYIDIGFAGLSIEDGADVHFAVTVILAPSGSDGLLNNADDSLSW